MTSFFGDRNSTFFHTQTIVWRKQNKVHGLFLDDGLETLSQKPLRRRLLGILKINFQMILQAPPLFLRVSSSLKFLVRQGKHLLG